MAIWIGNRTEPRTLGAKVAVWAKQLLILGFICWAVFAVRNYSEDTHSHAIKESFPLLFGFGHIVYRPADYDPDKAEWGPVHEAVCVDDGQIVFIQIHQAIYALKFTKQTLEPEQAEYEYVEVGSSSPIVKSVSASFPGGIRLPGATVSWSGRAPGRGFIYIKNSFMPGRKSRFLIGVPFYSGELDSYSKAVPAEVHFESLPYKIGEAPDGF